MTNAHLFARAAGVDARAAGAPPRLRRGEGVARVTIRQRVGERDQSCCGFQVLQWYEPFRQIVVVAFSVRQNEATDVEDSVALREDDLEKMRWHLWERRSRQPLRHRRENYSGKNNSGKAPT